MKINHITVKTTILATGLALIYLTCGARGVTAGEVLLGSSDFQPTPNRPIGWRGDGSGKYPAATPPLRWERAAKTVKQLRFQATKPKEGETGKPLTDGVIHEWLILGPVPVPDELKQLDKDILPDEAKLEPDEGAKTGDFTWKKISPDGQTINFRVILGMTNQIQAVVYACAYVYSESAQSFQLNVMSSGHRLLVNGIQPKGPISLQKGWNRILFRVQCGKNAGDWRNKAPEFGVGPDPKWYLRSIFYGTKGTGYDTANIAWSARVPGYGISAPVIVGDKVLGTAEHRSIYCLNKSDGKLIWMRTITLNDVATEEEKKASPEVFQEIAPLAAKLAELDRSVTPGTTLSNELISAKQDAENKIMGLMKKVDPKKYAVYPPGEGGVSSPNITSDGKNVYAAFLPYLVACFDLDGNRQWVKMHEMVPPYSGWESHGMYSSPILLDGKLIYHSDRLVALDAKSGKFAWQTNDPGYFSSLLSTTIDKEPLLVTCASIVRARDGQKLSFFKNASITPTPVIADGKVFRFGLDTIRLPVSLAEPFKVDLIKNVAIDTRNFPKWYCGSYSASPLYHEGLLYCINEDGVLSVVDTEKQEVLYQKLLDLDLEMYHGGPGRGGACSSPTLAGNYIFIFGVRGTCVVIKPGKTFQQAAQNRLETPYVARNYWGYPEQVVACPVFEGKRLYIRALENLHCIEEK